MNLRLVSVNVGLPCAIATEGERPVLSGIGKRPLHSATVLVSPTNIEGDRQADLTVHGGPDKAVYAYPSEHWAWWQEEHGFSCAPAKFGENLTLLGADESSILIGDQFRWGDVVLEVSQPRAPCYKLAIHTGRADLPALMTQSARCGWYFRVLKEGAAPVASTMLTRISSGLGPSVRDAFATVFSREANRETRSRLLQNPALANAWRKAAERRAS
ncbi:MAG: MOSC domain-containing protein [Alphaproteobacteria bacterium]|nr:MOSC domain-containing protein [Alphaproteobacteria bacterium]